MANHLRGEIDADFGNGLLTLCLPLQAMANLEQRLQVSGIAELLSRFQGEVRAQDLLQLLTCALMASQPLNEEEAQETLRQVTPAYLIDLAGRLIATSFGEVQSARPFVQESASP